MNLNSYENICGLIVGTANVGDKLKDVPAETLDAFSGYVNERYIVNQTTQKINSPRKTQIPLSKVQGFKKITQI